MGGEDALIGWAEAAILDQRDAFMARQLFAAAQGRVSDSPAFAPEGGPPALYRFFANGNGGGGPEDAAGPYVPIAGPRAVVGVVGAAHVGGIEAEWRKLLDGRR